MKKTIYKWSCYVCGCRWRVWSTEADAAVHVTSPQAGCEECRDVAANMEQVEKFRAENPEHGKDD